MIIKIFNKIKNNLNSAYPCFLIYYFDKLLLFIQSSDRTSSFLLQFKNVRNVRLSQFHLNRVHKMFTYHCNFYGIPKKLAIVAINM